MFYFDGKIVLTVERRRDNQVECWLSKLKSGKCELCTNELVMQANFDK